MRILHLSPYYAPAYAFGGVVRAVEGIATAQAAQGHAVTVLTTDALDPRTRTTDPRDELRDGVRVVRVPNVLIRGTLNLSTPRGLGAAAQPLITDADVVHLHEFRTVENLLVTPIAARLRKPVVMSPHGTLTLTTGRSAVKSGWDRLFSRLVARRISTVIALTERERDEAQAVWRSLGSTDAHFAVVPNGVDPSLLDRPGDGAAFRQRYGLGDAPVCLFLGRLHPRKGAQLLAEAFARIDLPDARLVIAGPDEGALALIRPHLSERMVMTGYLGPSERLDALAAADVFALPATGEGLSLALLEALASALPVVVAPGAGLPDITAAGAGIEVAPEPAALAGAVGGLLADAAQRARMGSAARQLVAERYTWPAVVAQLETVYGQASQ
jgi:glycosyltransferase involved in cell wall biosynthesis